MTTPRPLYANIASALIRVDGYIRNNPNALYEVEGREINRIMSLAMAENSERNAELIALRAQVRELEEALEFYAHRPNYDIYGIPRIPHKGHKGCTVPDQGVTARAALAKVKETK